MKIIGFRVRIDSAGGAGGTGREDATWEAISGGGQAFRDCPPPRPRQRQRPRVGDVVLSGPFDADREELVQWYRDTVEPKDPTRDPARDVRVTYLGLDADGSIREVEQVHYLDCFLTHYQLGPVEADGSGALTETLHFEVSRVELA